MALINSGFGPGVTPPSRQTLIGMVSLGCPKNTVDGEAMLGLLKTHGYGFTRDARLADYIIVNTCGFIDAAKKESIDAILEMADMKKIGRCRGLIVTGCLSERYHESFAAELPEVDAALGVGEYGRICETVEGLVRQCARSEEGEPHDFGLPENRQYGGDEQRRGFSQIRAVRECTVEERLGHLRADRILTNGSGYVYIKISEGCGNNCSYCAIPSIRGGHIERPRADIVEEARRFTAEREIEAVIVAQDTGAYGAAGGNSGTAELCGLIDELSRIDRVRWIRLMYMNPDRIDDLLAERFVRNKKLARYLDMPIQHASDAVLRRMNRRYGKAELYGVINKLRGAAPDIVLRTTVLTGFPGESDADFAELKDFLARVKFERLGVFAYSKEEGTPASLMDGQVPKKVALRRRSELLRTQAALMAKYEASRAGLEYEAIIDAGPYISKFEEATYEARTYAEAPQIDGTIRVSAQAAGCSQAAPPSAGSFVRIKIMGADSKGMYGTLLI